MYTYHVYFTTHADVTEPEIQEVFSKFIDSEIRENRMISYGLTKFENKASFPELSDYHFTAHYGSKKDQEAAMAEMSKRYTKEPHLSLMRITKEFRVAFSEEVRIIAADQDAGQKSGDCAPSE